MKESLPKRTTLRRVEFPRSINRSSPRQAGTRRRWPTILLYLVMMGSTVGSGLSIFRLYQRWQLALSTIEARNQMADEQQQRLRILATQAIERLSLLADAVSVDPALVRDTLNAARQVAVEQKLSDEELQARIKKLPLPRSLSHDNRVRLSGITVEKEEIYATLTVQTAAGDFVHGLNRGDIEVRTAGKRLHAVTFREAQRSVLRHEIAVVLDTSGSTAGAAHSTLKSASAGLIRTLANPNRLRVWKFADTVEPLSPWSLDSELHEQAIAKLTAGGGTALYLAVRTAAESLSEREGARAIVVFTDGKDSRNDNSLDATIELCRQRSIAIHVVMLETSETKEELLRRMATVTGGTFHRASNPAELVDRFRDVALRFQQPCYRLHVYEPVGSGQVTLHIGDLPEIPLAAKH